MQTAHGTWQGVVTPGPQAIRTTSPKLARFSAEQQTHCTHSVNCRFVDKSKTFGCHIHEPFSLCSRSASMLAGFSIWKPLSPLHGSYSDLWHPLQFSGPRLKHGVFNLG